MDLIASLLRENAPELTSGLESAGLSTDEAERLLPEAADATLTRVRSSGSFDVRSLLDGSGGISSFMAGLDVGGLAARLGIEESKVASALQVFVPQLLGLLQSKGGDDVLSLLGGPPAGGLVSGVRKLASKLFQN